MSIQPSDDYQRAKHAYDLFPHWLAQQGELPDNISKDQLEERLMLAFSAGYMEGSK